MRIRRGTILLIVFLLSDTASGAYQIFVGPSAVTGPVRLPLLYRIGVSDMAKVRFDFDDMAIGQELRSTDLGGIVPVLPPGSTLMVQADQIGAALVNSERNGVLMSNIQPVNRQMSLVMTDAVMSLGLAVLGAENGLRVRVYDIGGDEIEQVILPGFAEERFWLGIVGGERSLVRVDLETLLPGDVGFDDMEIGFHLPEPATLAGMWVGGLMLLGGRGLSRRRVRGR